MTGNFPFTQLLFCFHASLYSLLCSLYSATSVKAVCAKGSRTSFSPVVQAADGLQALDKFNPQIDLVLLDGMLPKVSGTEVCRRLRLTSQVPIIMVTAKDSEIDENPAHPQYLVTVRGLGYKIVTPETSRRT